MLIGWIYYAEDKTFIFLLIALLLLALDRRDDIGAWAATTGLAVFKFLGVFSVPALAVDTYRRRGRKAAVPVGVSIVVFAVSNLLWFPSSLEIAETVVWSIFLGYIFLPDDNFDRLLLISLPFLLILSPSPLQ